MAVSTLLLLAAGSVALALWGLVHAEPWVVIFSLAPLVVDLWVAALKFRDWVCTRMRIPVGGHHRGRHR